MSRPRGIRVAENAAQKAREGRITYAQQDCQAFVEHCVIDCGGKMSYAGSNDMYRNACEWVKQLSGKPADLEPGMLVFKHAFDGGEPAKYKSDGKGNARHVGMYCGVDGVEVAHSSTTTIGNGAQIAKLSTGWTHYGPAKCIEYGAEESGQEGGTDMPTQTATVYAANGDPVRLRPTPGTEKPYIAKVPVGTVATVTETAQNGEGAEWSKVKLPDGKTGYMMTSFLRFNGDSGAVEPEGEQVTRDEFEALKRRVEALEGGAG